ncbi:MAG: aminoacyl-tRNA hydrolase [Nitrospirales bacterium]|nr:aminoacyl-tRNA hydrolase [Nitrospirales bacterium]
MWVIAGLGNPGRKYSRTRHNVGFMVVDMLSQEYGISLREGEKFSIGEGVVEGERVLLLKPLTYMNRSGLAVREVLKRDGIRPEQLIVIHDDLDMDTGVVKIRKDGSSGGQKGIASIIQELGAGSFVRIKIGIGRDRNVPVSDYVLSDFPSSEKLIIKDAIINAMNAVGVIVTEGVDMAMNRFNRSPKAHKAATRQS